MSIYFFVCDQVIAFDHSTTATEKCLWTHPFENRTKLSPFGSRGSNLYRAPQGKIECDNCVTWVSWPSLLGQNRIYTNNVIWVALNFIVYDHCVWCSPGISAMKTFSRSLTFPCSPNAGTMLLSVICTRSSIIYPLLLTLTTLTPGLRSVTWIPVLLFLLSVVWPCAKNPFILMLQHSGITSLRTSSNAILCSPSSQPSVPILASQFHCLFWWGFFSVFFFYFPYYFWCFVVFGLPLIYCFCNIGLCQALGRMV